ncbi:glutaredoxin family protein [Vibrio sp. RE86]|nr:glutaredoxin family protein [Vibrio sp. RE86]
MAFSLTQQINISNKVDIVDIAFDDELFSRYGVTIPVLNFNGNELNWPFDLEQLQVWLDNNGITYDK